MLSVDELLLLPIEELDLTVRPYNVLKRMGIHTFGDVLELTLDDLNQWVTLHPQCALQPRSFMGVAIAQDTVRENVHYFTHSDD